MCICEKPSQCSSRSARAPRFFTASSRARPPVSRTNARARGGPGSPTPPHLPSSFVARDDGFLSTRFLAALVVAAWAFVFAPGASASFHVEKANFNVRVLPLDQGDVRDVHRELRHAALRCHPRVRPPATSRLFSARRAPRSRPDARPLRTTRSDDLFFLSRSRAPIERLPALTHPRPSPPPQRHAGVPPPRTRTRAIRSGCARDAPLHLSRVVSLAPSSRSEEVLFFFRLLLRRRA